MHAGQAVLAPPVERASAPGADGGRGPRKDFGLAGLVVLAVVPDDQTLEVEALVRNKEIGFVRAGQTATVKIKSLPYTRDGYLTGTVENVSLDAMQHEQLGLVFLARVKLERAHLNIDGVRVQLTPAMGLYAEVKTGTRRPVDYVLSPLRSYADESLKERWQ